jgi:hypothetical protein
MEAGIAEVTETARLAAEKALRIEANPGRSVGS